MASNGALSPEELEKKYPKTPAPQAQAAQPAPKVSWLDSINPFKKSAEPITSAGDKVKQMVEGRKRGGKIGASAFRKGGKVGLRKAAGC